MIAHARVAPVTKRDIHARGMQIGFRHLLVAVSAIASGGVAMAIGFGPVRANVLLGQPLNLAVPVALAEGETLSSECASAEVTAGEVKLPPGSARVRVTQGRDARESVLRVTTSGVVEEPVLSVTLHVGCPTRLSRTMVLLADPPLVTTLTATTERAPTLATVAPPAPAPQPPMPAPAIAPPPPPTQAAAPRVARPAPPSRVTRSAPARTVVAEAAPAAPTTARAAPPAARRAAAPESRPRLRLDAGQVSLTDAAVQVAREQASAAQAAASAAEAAASAAAERLQTLEAELTRVRAEAKAQTDALMQIRQELALDRAQRDKPSPWLATLAAVAALLAALVVWLAWRVRRQAAAPVTAADWWERASSSMAPPDLPSEFQRSQAAGLSSAHQRLPSAPAPLTGWSDSSQAPDSPSSPMTVPAPTAVTIPPVPEPVPEPEVDRAMSVDEQIDLEQQADFFSALGHDDAAIDLLMAHMRSTGGGSPLPFLKLLEIHRRRDQREAYERTRMRFNQRFNGVAPEWQADPKTGRKLEDYPLALGRIQRVWPAPLDALAELEALLFRRGEGVELFDLPAYQEVLFLYQLARDLHDADNRGVATDIDVLLPIGGRSAPLDAAQGTIVLRPEFTSGQAVSLDLDLSGASVTGELKPPASPEDVSADAAAASAAAEIDLELTQPVEPLERPAAQTDAVWSEDPDLHRRDS